MDGCGGEENVQLWYDLLAQETAARGIGRVMVENCHNGPNVPTADWCPFHMYRASTDIAPVWGSILANVNTLPALAAGNLSRPGCWAYADMLEIGVTNLQGRMPHILTHAESRSHFAMWAVTSTPLVLGMDLTNATMLDAVWDVITNTEVIAVHQDYVGHSGTLFYSSDVMVPSEYLC